MHKAISDRRTDVVLKNETSVPPNTNPKPIQKRWAFLVGINSYVDPAFSKLSFCINDVRALQNTLSRLNYETVCLHDELKSGPRFPSRNNIEAELATFCEQVGEDDLLWVHFACHGMRLEEQSGKEQPVLIAQDTRRAILPFTSLPLSRVEELMGNSKAKRRVLTLDACETGVEMGRNSNAPDFIKNVRELAEGYALISASTAKQAAQERSDVGHGAFTHFLLNGLKEGAKDEQGNITISRLYNYVLNEFRSRNIQQGGQLQEPTYRSQGIGDIILTNLNDVKLNVSLKSFDFEVSSLEIINQRWGKKSEIIRGRGNIEFFEEKIEDVTLQMAQIPRGTFFMGSSEDEPERFPTEGPQRQVNISSPFFMSLAPITQRQWRVVAGLPPVDKTIKLELDPSHFEGDDRPVEKVSWFEAVEFCERLSIKTGRSYRLPSEAEWEYACRAGTTSPFHYGATISTDLANYRGTNYKEKEKEYKGFYGGGSQGKYRGETIKVMQFSPNAFGLYDMHGNVYEWCMDYWHDNYENAPTDSSVWTDGGFETHRVLRGGSWANNPGSCRSASRLGYYPAPRVAIIGFRVVCGLL
ncbi:MAG: SUMF1/EgtB/PvdO family nonheme iron enzyme [Oscillatoriophycideae cyanobacterium NC_groundwater_1537_Pr4_S-0.65um_50_18]|nr:SUMF1/EgtB/PvdO family nonheme iron enzyme [Oscillatoriophycideae cyanobacterium NC_groundwater_1537_Pr4_S-0.65um_50_18]